MDGGVECESGACDSKGRSEQVFCKSLFTSWSKALDGVEDWTLQIQAIKSDFPTGMATSLFPVDEFSAHPT